MIISSDINPYVLYAIEEEFAQSIMPPEKKNFTDAYRKTINAVRERMAQDGAEPLDEYTQLSVTPAELAEFPQKEMLKSGYNEILEGQNIDYYA